MWILGGIIAAALGWQWFKFNQGPRTETIALGQGYSLKVKIVDSHSVDWTLIGPVNLPVTGGHNETLEEALSDARRLMAADVAARKLAG